MALWYGSSLISRWRFYFLPPETKLGQGNIFRSVCQEFSSQGGSPGPHQRGKLRGLTGRGSPGPHPGRSWGVFPGGSPGSHQGGGWGVWLGGLQVHTQGGLQAQAWGDVYPSIHWGRHPQQMATSGAVRILLECILVVDVSPFLWEMMWTEDFQFILCKLTLKTIWKNIPTYICLTSDTRAKLKEKMEFPT